MKKSILPLIIGLVVGLGAGYFIFKLTASYPFANYKHGFVAKDLTEEEKFILKDQYMSNSFVFSDSAKMLASGTTAKMIASSTTNADAFKRIQEFKTENHNCSYPLLTNFGSEQIGYFINGDDLRTILNDPINFDGISVYFAKDYSASQAGTTHVYTLVFTGAKQRPYVTGTPRDYDHSPYVNPGTENSAFDFILPCPTFCGNFDFPPPTITNATKKTK